jgi:diphthamide synthase (EF-2-diphthine--ammonia ligase)
VRHYREKQLAGTGIDPLFPLWQVPTLKLAEQMLTAGLEAYVSSVDIKKLPASFAGRRWSRDLLKELPAGGVQPAERALNPLIYQRSATWQASKSLISPYAN